MATETELAIKKLQDEVINLRKRLEGMLSRKGGYIAGSLAYEGDLRPQRSAVGYEGCIFVPLITPLTSTAWDGDSFSTIGKTLIDLSAVFGVPAGVKAVDIKVALRDSGSSGAPCYIILSPNNVASQGKTFSIEAVPNDIWRYNSMTVNCDANGDIYYQLAASGAGALDVLIEIWGYWL